MSTYHKTHALWPWMFLTSLGSLTSSTHCPSSVYGGWWLEGITPEITPPDSNHVQRSNTFFIDVFRPPAPSYLTEVCIPVATNKGRRHLRSATHGDLSVPRTRTITYGPWSFAASVPSVWNDLLTYLRSSSITLRQFQSGLKTILFRLAYY